MTLRSAAPNQRKHLPRSILLAYAWSFNPRGRPMTLSEDALSRISAPSSHMKTDADIDGIHKNANDRKREVYWIGFLDGALASERIEPGEEMAILAEADRF